MTVKVLFFNNSIFINNIKKSQSFFSTELDGLISLLNKMRLAKSLRLRRKVFGEFKKKIETYTSELNIFNRFQTQRLNTFINSQSFANAIKGVYGNSRDAEALAETVIIYTERALDALPVWTEAAAAQYITPDEFSGMSIDSRILKLVIFDYTDLSLDGAFNTLINKI
tara:strand:- start:111 stop:614 length:504 start_codon:yes stop_codon:yes gene_type:complete